MIYVKLLVLYLIILGSLNYNVDSVDEQDFSDDDPDSPESDQNPDNTENPQIHIEEAEEEENELPQALFCNTGQKDVPSLFVGGYKFWHNKDKNKDGVVRGFFYCSCKKPPPNGFSCKASASALKIGDGDWNLVRLNDNHPGILL